MHCPIAAGRKADKARIATSAAPVDMMSALRPDPEAVLGVFHIPLVDRSRSPPC